MPTINFTAGDDSYVASPPSDSPDPLVLNFLAGNDRLRTVSGTTEAHMGDGNDYARSDSGSFARIFGEEGDDRIDLYGSGFGVGKTADGGAGNDLFHFYGGTGLRVFGSDGADRFNFYGDVPWFTENVRLRSLIEGGAGDDLFFAYGHDVGIVFGGPGNDSFYGLAFGSGDSTAAYGGLGNDLFRVVPNGLASFIELAGEGTDTVQVAYGAAYTLPENVENLRAVNFATVGTFGALHGNSLANRIIGGSLAESLKGQAGNDVLIGYGGNDVLQGGEGRDRLVGGTGDDVFVFTDLSRDRIADFVSGSDVIDLGWLMNGEDFEFIGGAAFSGTPGEGQYLNGVFRLDIDGNGLAEFAIDVATQLSANDFSFAAQGYWDY